MSGLLESLFFLNGAILVRALKPCCELHFNSKINKFALLNLNKSLRGSEKHALSYFELFRKFSAKYIHFSSDKAAKYKNMPSNLIQYDQSSPKVIVLSRYYKKGTFRRNRFL